MIPKIDSTFSHPPISESSDAVAISEPVTPRQFTHEAISQVLDNAKDEGKLYPVLDAIVVCPKHPSQENVARFGSCNLCLESVQNEVAATKDTLVIMLSRDPVAEARGTHQPYVDVSLLSRYLPFKDSSRRSMLLDKLPLNLSFDCTPSAIHALSRLHQNNVKKIIRNAMQEAKKKTIRQRLKQRVM